MVQLQPCPDSSVVPDDPLKTHTAYVATATWSPADGVPAQTLTWRFVTGAGDGVNWGGGAPDARGTGSSCSMQATARAKRARPKGRWRITIQPCAAKRVKLALRSPKRRARWQGRVVWKRRVLWKRELRPTSPNTKQLSVPVRRLKRGSYQLQVQLLNSASKQLLNRTIALQVRG